MSDSLCVNNAYLLRASILQQTLDEMAPCFVLAELNHVTLHILQQIQFLRNYSARPSFVSKDQN